MLDLKQYLRDKLYPHLGYFDLIVRFIDRSEIKTLEEIDFILSKLDNKNLVKSLPRVIQSYKSYYILVFDIIYTEEKNKLVKFLKDNIPSCSRGFFIDALKNESNVKSLKSIIKNEGKLAIFLRWSSRIKSSQDAVSYIQDVIKEEKSVNLIYGLQGVNSIDGFSIIEMKNHFEVKDVIPTSWCIKNARTFDDYTRSYSAMYMFIKDREIYGVNISHTSDRANGMGGAYILDKNNRSVLIGTQIWNDIQNVLNKFQNQSSAPKEVTITLEEKKKFIAKHKEKPLDKFKSRSSQIIKDIKRVFSK